MNDTVRDWDIMKSILNYGRNYPAQEELLNKYSSLSKFYRGVNNTGVFIDMLEVLGVASDLIALVTLECLCLLEHDSYLVVGPKRKMAFIAARNFLLSSRPSDEIGNLPFNQDFRGDYEKGHSIASSLHPHLPNGIDAVKPLNVLYKSIYEIVTYQMTKVIKPEYANIYREYASMLKSERNYCNMIRRILAPYANSICNLQAQVGYVREFYHPETVDGYAYLQEELFVNLTSFNGITEEEIDVEKFPVFQHGEICMYILRNRAGSHLMPARFLSVIE